ncbi:TonB-dependent receptor domain-containing protein, partial [Acidobacteriota bacterium]
FTYDLNPRNKLTLLNIYGDSRLEYDLKDAVEYGFNSYLRYGTSQNTSGINWFSNWGDNGYSNTSLSYSFFRIDHSITAVNSKSSFREHNVHNEYNGGLSFRSSSFFKLGQSTDIQFGIDWNNHLISFDNYISEYISRWEEELPEVRAEGRTLASQSGAFVTLSFRPFSRLSAAAGFRVDHYSYNDHWLFSPRISLAWEAAKRLTLSAAFGIFHQNVPLSVQTTNLENKKNKDPYALHYIIGFSYKIFEDVNLSIDIYDKEYRALPLTRDDPTLFVMDSGVDMAFYRSYDVLLDTGLAYARGIEFLLQKKLMQGFYGLVSGTVFRSRFQDATGVWRNRINDNVYALKIIGGYLPKNGWGLSVRFNLSGGLPYTPFDLELSEEYNRSIYIREKALANRHPPYMTMDIRIDKEIRWEKSSLYIYFGATNMFNRKNIDSYYWNRIENKLDKFFQAPILPVFGFELVF